MSPESQLCVHQLFEAQAERTPNATAVVRPATLPSGARPRDPRHTDYQELTYGELNARANQLARYLRSLGVGPEVPVGICMDRSLETVVGLLGILKAGGAYVPLDPATPRERMAFVLEDVEAPLLLTRERFVTALPALTAQVICLDTGWDAIGRESAEHLTVAPAPGNLAQVIYTSGSTGTPKGVMIEHRALAHYVATASRAFELGPGDRVLQFASISFDVAGEEIFASLATGATLVLRIDAMLESVAVFLQRCRDWDLTVLDLPTAYWHEVTARLDTEPLGIPPLVRLVVIGGERALPQAVAAWRKYVHGRVRLINAYGPTEATIAATLCDLSNGEYDPAARHVPIGRPIPNVQTYVLDRDLQPVADGAEGELHIGGVGLARGYLRRPELTAERFIRDPFSAAPDARLYRTGDLARYQPDGNLEFVGRVDHQVKIRGFRVELGEIEVALRQCPDVRDAVVALREDAPHETQLVAYVESPADATPSPSALRRFLKDRLPEYMVPATFVLLDALPRLPSGKVDRPALPAPRRTREQSGAAYAGPRTATETVLCGIFSRLLGVEAVGTADGFFELGGHSLMAARLIAEVRTSLSVDLSLGEVFERPTPAGLAALIEGRDPDEVKLPALPVVGRASRTGALPLSFSQEPVWFLRRLEPENQAYNAQFAVRLRGRLDVPALEQALTEIVRRHEVLRTTFLAHHGQPVQEIHAPFAVELPLVDFSRLPPDQGVAQADQRIAEECGRTFDVTHLPLVHWTLLRIGATEHVLVQTEHHFVHDGWSIAILLRELLALYGAFTRSEPSPLSELPLQFADYAVWQRQSLQGERLARLVDYWRRRLAGSPPVLALPTDRPRPKVQTFAGALQTRDLDPERYEQLRAFGKREGLTPFMVMLAAFKTLLARYTGASDLLVATSVANRPTRELEELIGMFVNTVVLRTDCSGDPSFRELARRVRETALAAYSHQDLPFEKLVEHLAPTRDWRYNPVFQVMFSFHDSPVPDIVLPDLAGRVEYLHNGSAKFDLNVVVIARREQRVGLETDAAREVVTVEFEYNTDLFDHATISRMLDHYQVLLEAALRDPEQHLSDLPLLTEPERQQLLVAWNDTTQDYPRDECVHDLIEAQARTHPDAVAVMFQGRQLTYGELWHQVERLARNLHDRGAGPGTRVAVYLERSLEMVVALLATLRTGAAYVPFDPGHPAQRIEYEQADAGTAIVITQQQLRERLPPGRMQTVCIDEPGEPGVVAMNGSSLPRVSPESPAYVIYTSGSTGRPKGVEVSHRALVNCLWSMARRLAVGPQDHGLAITTIAFDIAGLELYLPLIVGGRVEVIPSAVASDGRLLAHAAGGGDATLLQATPATWRLLLHAGWSGHAKLRALCGGEALPTDLARALLARCGALYNVYGPTETTIWSALHEVRPEDDPVPIGAPIANTVIHILDANRKLVPVGVSGEVYIGGDGVAHGYVGRPDLTAQRFVPGPGDHTTPRRLYRTGDLARRRSDGSLEFLGRIDHQIKLRGFRVELEEIEAVLREHVGVLNCVAALADLGPDDRRLVAYVVPALEASADAADWKAFLSERLPDYMLPAAFVALDSLPLTSSGKVDRKALPAVNFNHVTARGDDAAPRSPMEISVARLWQEVLGVEHVGRFDNFFDLGGHSLLSMQVIARIEEEHGVWLAPRDMMLQNCSQLAAVCEERARQRPSPAGQERSGWGRRMLRRLHAAIRPL